MNRRGFLVLTSGILLGGGVPNVPSPEEDPRRAEALHNLHNLCPKIGFWDEATGKMLGLDELSPEAMKRLGMVIHEP